VAIQNPNALQGFFGYRRTHAIRIGRRSSWCRSDFYTVIFSQAADQSSVSRFARRFVIRSSYHFPGSRSTYGSWRSRFCSCLIRSYLLCGGLLRNNSSDSSFSHVSLSHNFPCCLLHELDHWIDSGPAQEAASRECSTALYLSGKAATFSVLRIASNCRPSLFHASRFSRA